MTLWNLLIHISMKHFRLRKAQVAMAIAGICLGVTAIVSIGVVNKSVLFSLSDSFNRITGRAQIQITGAQSGFPESFVEKVQNVRGVEYAVPVIEADGMLAYGKERSILILGVDVLVDTQVRDYSLSGETADVPDPLLFLAKPDSILVTKTMADREGFRIDQKIQVQTVEGIKTFRIRGILNPEGPAKAMGGNLAIMDIYAAQMAFGKTGRVDRIDVCPRAGENPETVRQAIAAALPQGYKVDTPVGRTKQVEAMISRFQNGFDVISYLAIFVGMYLIYNAVSISVVNRRKEIGILRALGCRRKDIMTLFLAETLVMAAIASVLGIILGLILADALVGAFGKIISTAFVRTSADAIHVDWVYPAVGLASGISASLIAALFPARASVLISPVSAIRSVPYTEEKFFTARRLNIAGILCLVFSGFIFWMYHVIGDSPLTKSKTIFLVAQLTVAIGISLFIPFFLKGFVSVFNRLYSPFSGAAGRLAGLNLRKNLTRNAVAVSAVFFGISVFVASASYVSSVQASALTWLDSIIRADMIVSSGHPGSSPNNQSIPLPVEMSRQLENVPGVASVESWRRVLINYNDRKVLLSVFDFDRFDNSNDLKKGKNAGDDRREYFRDRQKVVVSEPFAAIFKVRQGDQLTLPTPAGPAAFTVAGIVVDYTSNSGVIGMDVKTYQRHWGDRLCDSFLIHLQPEAKIANVQNEIQRRFGMDRKLFTLPAKEFKDEIRKVLDRMFIFNYAVNVITLAIACLGIIVALFASVLERTREIGTLRAIGMLKRQIYGVVVLESLLMGLAGGILGAASGLIAGWINLKGFFVASYGSAQYHPSIAAVILALCLAAGMSVLAGMIPARKAAKTNIVEALAYD